MGGIHTPSQTVRLVLFTLVLFLTVDKPTNAADPAGVEGPEWRHGFENEWCFSMSHKKACLPVGFELTRFQPGYAWWHQWRDPGHIIQIKYEESAPEYDDMFTITLTGTELVRMREIAHSLAEQWSSMD